MRAAQQRGAEEARELQARFEAERRAARAELANVDRSSWWDQLTPGQVGHAYQVARAWREDDPEIARAEQRMREEIRTRWGVDVDDAQADPAALRVAIERAQRERTEAESERGRSEAERAEAHRLLTQAEQEDRRADQARAAAEHEPDLAERAAATRSGQDSAAVPDQVREDSRQSYDSAERRQASAAELKARGIDPKVVDTRMRADVSQATPATEAVRPDFTQSFSDPGLHRGLSVRVRGSRARG